MSDPANPRPIHRFHQILGVGTLLVTQALLMSTAVAEGSNNKAVQDAQQKLNQQTIERGFSAPDPAGVETYIRDSMKRNLGPRQQPPSYWRSGYTCENALQYSHQDYLDCMYYHRRYGSYW